MSPWLIAMLGWMFDKAQLRPENARALETRQQMLDATRGSQTMVQNAGGMGPAVNFQGGRFGSANGPVVNLDPLFDTNQKMLAEWSQNAPGTDISPLHLNTEGVLQHQLGSLNQAGKSIDTLLAGAKPGDLLSGVSLPDSDLSDVLRGDLAGITSASRTREDLQRGNVAANAPAFGGMEGVRRESEGVGFSEGLARGTAGAQAVANNRMQEAQIQEFNAQLQEQAKAQAAGIDASLAQTGATSKLALGQSQADVYGQDYNRKYEQGVFNKGIETANLGRQWDAFLKHLGLVGGAEDEQKQAGLLALQTQAGEQSNQANAANSILSSNVGMSQVMQPFMDTQVLSLMSILGPLLQQKMSPKYDPGGSFGLSFMGTGFNTST